MDVLATSYLLKRFQADTFNGGDKDVIPTSQEIFVALLISCVAAFLSWNCAIKEYRSPFEAGVWAAMAFMFGGMYVSYYVLFREWWCRLL
jgi:CHASE2 domain-containing sensor protein